MTLFIYLLIYNKFDFCLFSSRGNMSVPKFYDSSYKSRYVPGQAIKMDIHNSQLPIHKLKHQTPSSKDGLNNAIEEDIRFAACETIQIACRYANISTPRIVVSIKS